MKINWSVRLRNKAFWVSITSAIVLLLQQLGFNEIVPDNIIEILNTILVIGTILGIIVDPTTNGLSDSDRVLDKAKKLEE